MDSEDNADYVSLINVTLNRGDAFHSFLTHLFFKKEYCLIVFAGGGGGEAAV